MKYEFAITKGRGTLIEYGVVGDGKDMTEPDDFKKGYALILSPVDDDCQTGK